VIITTREAELLVMIIYARTDCGPAVEVQRRIFHASYFAGGNQAFINGCKIVRVNGQLMTEHRAAARQVEIRMIR